MRLRFRIQNVDVDAATRAAIRRTVRLTLGRHAEGIEVALISLSPAPTVHDSAARRCAIRLQLKEGRQLAIEDCASDLPAATAGAAWRLEQRLQRWRIPLSSGARPRRRAVSGRASRVAQGKEIS